MGVLGRLPPSRDEPTISLSRVDLRSIALRDARLNGSRFRYANLARSVLAGVWLERSDLTAGTCAALTSIMHAWLEPSLAGPHCKGRTFAGLTSATRICAGLTSARPPCMTPC